MLLPQQVTDACLPISTLPAAPRTQHCSSAAAHDTCLCAHCPRQTRSATGQHVAQAVENAAHLAYQALAQAQVRAATAALSLPHSESTPYQSLHTCHAMTKQAPAAHWGRFPPPPCQTTTDSSSIDSLCMGGGNHHHLHLLCLAKHAGPPCDGFPGVQGRVPEQGEGHPGHLTQEELQGEPSSQPSTALRGAGLLVSAKHTGMPRTAAGPCSKAVSSGFCARRCCC